MCRAPVMLLNIVALSRMVLNTVTTRSPSGKLNQEVTVIKTHERTSSKYAKPHSAGAAFKR